MRQIIEGLIYDTETAILIAGDDYWDGSNFDRCGRNTYLYRTKKGAYFIHRTTLYDGERDHIEPVSKADAFEIYEGLPEKACTYFEAFGKEPVEA